MRATGCTVDGCDGAYCAQGLCKKHYMRMYRSGTLDVRPPRPASFPARFPIRHKADYCQVCGMSDGRHWVGCTESEAS